MLIEDIEKLIKQLREEQGMTQEEAKKEAFKRALEDMYNFFEVERGFDRPLGGLSAAHLDELEDDPELEGDIALKDDGKQSERKGFFRRIIDKFGKGGKSDDFEF